MGLPSLKDTSGYVDVFVQGGVHGEPAWGLVSTVLPILTPSKNRLAVGTGPHALTPLGALPSTTLVQRAPMYAPEMQDTYM